MIYKVSWQNNLGKIDFFKKWVSQLKDAFNPKNKAAFPAPFSYVIVRHSWEKGLFYFCIFTSFHSIFLCRDRGKRLNKCFDLKDMEMMPAFEL